METKTKKSRVAIALLISFGVMGMLFIAFKSNQGRQSGIFGTTASAQSIIPVPIQPQTATNMFIKFEGVDGESQDQDHKDWIDLLSFSQGQFVPANSIGTGAARTPSVFEEIIVKKKLDKASPKLAEAVCQGKAFPKVEIHVTRALSGGSRVTYYAYELENAVLTSYHIAGPASGDDIPAEDIALNFERIKAAYTQIDETGRSKGTVEYGWDVVANKPL